MLVFEMQAESGRMEELLKEVGEFRAARSVWEDERAQYCDKILRLEADLRAASDTIASQVAEIVERTHK